MTPHPGLAAVLTVVGLLTPTPAPHGAPTQARRDLDAPGRRATPDVQVPLRTDLGTLHHPVATSVPDAQAYFDQGLRLVFALDREGAEASFREAARLDPRCAACWWGVALALGPSLDRPMSAPAEREAWAALREAWARAPEATPRERALVDALGRRYGREVGVDRAARDSAWARALGEVARRFPDPDLHTLHAEALMLLDPGGWWTPGTDPRPGTLDALAILEGVLAKAPDHPGACHLLIHLVAEAHPTRALGCAGRLPARMPGAGRVVHAPAHLYLRLGRYPEALALNLRAVEVDRRGRPGGPPPHLHHATVAAAVLAGRPDVAAQAVRDLRALARRAPSNPTEAVRSHALALAVAVRFGAWDDLLAGGDSPSPSPYVRGLWHFARGMARAARGEPGPAREELAALRGVAADPGLRFVRIHPRNEAGMVLEVAELLLDGEVARAAGAAERAVERFRAAVAREDALDPESPPAWLLPARHWLGAALLEADRPAEAEAVYREDLTRAPGNGWALAGLAEALRRQGRGEAAEAAETRLEGSWGRAAVRPPGSRY